MRVSTRSLSLVLVLALAIPARAQFDRDQTRKLLEEYSLELFGLNAKAYMSPLVIVTNIGANHGFFNSAAMPKTDRLHFELSFQSVYTWVRDDQRTYTGKIPYETNETDSPEVQLFKFFMQRAVADGALQPNVTTATVFGDKGAWFRIPKQYIPIDPAQLKNIPDSLQLTNGTNQAFVFAAVPQLSIGTYKSTDMLVRYVPPIVFDTAVGKFSFFGIAVRHGFSNWFPRWPVDAAVQVSYQHSTIDNTIGATRARLAATTEMYSVNVHASRRFSWIEPFVGLSYEHLQSKGSYTFTLPRAVVDQIGYDINPQVARVSLDDDAVKATIGATAYVNIFEAFVSVGMSKHVILGAGISANFNTGWGN